MKCYKYCELLSEMRKISHKHVYQHLNYRHFSSNVSNASIVNTMRKQLNIKESEAQYLCMKNPVINKLTEQKFKSLLDMVYEVGFTKTALIQEPLLFSILPISLKYRYKVLEECGFANITPKHIASFLFIVKKKTIGEMRESGEISDNINIENKLAKYMTQWPTSLTTLLYSDVNDYTLYLLRLKIIQRYFELVIDLNNEEFYRGIETYPTIKHRPLALINETLTILMSQIMMPIQKIKANLYLTHVDPDNLKQIIFNFRSIGGIDIKEVIRMHPKIATKNYLTLLEIRKILEEHNISNEAQRRCFDIYTLGPNTVRERLENAKMIPEFHMFVNHPRFLKIIHYKNTAMKRLRTLSANNKKCSSLNILSGAGAHYEVFEKAPGDRLGKGKDLLFCVSECLGKTYGMNQLRKALKRHPFWINIPLVQIKSVYQHLSCEYSNSDIYDNCPILLYPWNKVSDILSIINQKTKHHLHDQLDFENLTKSKKLSLVLYLLEKNHYFTGNGVWLEERNKNIDLSNAK